MRLASASVSPPALLAGLLVVLGHLPAAVRATCYYPNGDTANDTPCSSDTDESACCGTGYACFGVSSQYYLCKATGSELLKSGASTYVRGSCTDSTWRSGNCPSVCVDEDRDDVAGGNGVGKCPDSDTLYYCISTGLGEANCSTGYDLIDFASTPTALTTIGVAASTTSSSTKTHKTSTTLTTSTTSTESASTTASSAAATGTDTAATATDTASSGGGSHSKVGVGVGVGIGVPVGLAAIGLVFFFVRRRNNKQKADREAAASVAGATTPGAGAGGAAYLSPEMAKAPAGYAPTPNLGGQYPPTSPSPVAPSELYDAPYSSAKDTTVYSGSSPPPTEPTISEMPAVETRYEMP